MAISTIETFKIIFLVISLISSKRPKSESSVVVQGGNDLDVGIVLELLVTFKSFIGHD